MERTKQTSTRSYTKRAFDAQHKRNYGQPMPSDTREDYRAEMRRDYSGSHRPDRLAVRARYKAATPSLYGALVLGSALRAGYRFRYATTGRWARMRRATEPHTS